jgi:anti-anti-sigma factor
MCFVRLAQAEYGSLDPSKLVRLRRLLLYLAVHTTAERVVLGLTNVQFFGAGFVGVLVDTWDQLRKVDRRLALCGLTPYCARLIRIMHLDKLFDIHSERETAPTRVRQPVDRQPQHPHAASAQVRLTEVDWNPDMVREEYLDADGEPIHSVIRPRHRSNRG